MTSQLSDHVSPTMEAMEEIVSFIIDDPSSSFTPDYGAKRNLFQKIHDVFCRDKKEVRTKKKQKLFSFLRKAFHGSRSRAFIAACLRSSKWRRLDKRIKNLEKKISVLFSNYQENHRQDFEAWIKELARKHGVENILDDTEKKSARIPRNTDEVAASPGNNDSLALGGCAEEEVGSNDSSTRDDVEAEKIENNGSPAHDVANQVYGSSFEEEKTEIERVDDTEVQQQAQSLQQPFRTTTTTTTTTPTTEPEGDDIALTLTASTDSSRLEGESIPHPPAPRLPVNSPIFAHCEAMNKLKRRTP